MERFVQCAYALDPTQHDALEAYLGYVSGSQEYIAYTDIFWEQARASTGGSSWNSIDLAFVGERRQRAFAENGCADFAIDAAFNIVTLHITEMQGGWSLEPAKKLERYNG